MSPTVVARHPRPAKSRMVSTTSRSLVALDSVSNRLLTIGNHMITTRAVSRARPSAGISEGTTLSAAGRTVLVASRSTSPRREEEVCRGSILLGYESGARVRPGSGAPLSFAGRGVRADARQVFADRFADRRTDAARDV